jgi:TM2 domain-containing membrane protein YozV
MNKLLTLLPNIEQEELVYIQMLVKDMNDNQITQYASIYSSRRKDPQTILLLTLIGFFGVAGVQRFVLDQIGMGLLYLFTGGICVIGTIVDLINYKRLATEFNHKLARQVAAIVSN